MAEAQQLPLSARAYTPQRRVVGHRLGYGDGTRRHTVERLLQRVGIAELRAARAHESGVDGHAPLGRALGEAPYKGIEQRAARLDGALPPGILRLDFGRPRQSVERGLGATRERRIGLRTAPRSRHSHRPASASGLGLQRGRHIVVDRQQIRSHLEKRRREYHGVLVINGFWRLFIAAHLWRCDGECKVTTDSGGCLSKKSTTCVLFCTRLALNQLRSQKKCNTGGAK